MALKTKEKLNNEVEKVAKTKAVKAKTDVKKEPKKTATKAVKKAPSTKKATTKKEKNDNLEKVIDKKVTKIETSKKTSSKKVEKTSPSTSKVAEKKVSSADDKKAPKSKALKTEVKESLATKTTKTKKDTKSTTKTTKKSEKSKKTSSKTTKKTTSKSKTSAKSPRKAKAKVVSINNIEYYDLPYRYNQTVVKVLAQNPNTLFVYWDISDEDRLNFEEKYGKDFFYKTRPVLVIHNLTKNYTFEIDINDFANNWYVNVEDTKCKYLVELGRRPNYYESQAIPVNFLNIAFSNTIEIPNDRILFFKDNDRIYFKNIKTNKITEKVFKKETYARNVKGIYKNYNLDLDNNRFDFNNPSSQNPTSTLL